MVNSMTSKQLNQKLITLLPEIEELYTEEVNWQEGDETGSHVVFGDVLVPFVLKNSDFDIIKKCFDVVESILELNDEYAEEVITLSFLENFVYENDYYEKQMKERTKKIFNTLKNSLNYIDEE